LFRQPQLIEAAAARASRLALIAHKREGVPIAVWRENRVVWVPPEEIEIPAEEATFPTES
jgi:hypothetical protein